MDKIRKRTSENERNISGHRSLESSLENMEVDGVPYFRISSNNSSGSANVTSDESGIVLESPFRRPGLPIRSYNGDGYEESSEDSDYETSDHEVFYSTPKVKRMKNSVNYTNPLSIFKIDLEKVDLAIDKKDNRKIGTIKTNEERINFMIEFSNPKPKRRRAQQTTTTKHSIYEPKSFRGFFNSNSKFELVLFRKLTSLIDAETGEKMVRSQNIRFLYRHDGEAEEIFALPSGPSRSVVTPWTDTNFPLSVASAILDGKSVTEKEVKNLFENRYLTRFKMKKGEKLTSTPEFHLRFAPQVYTQFHANINDSNGELLKILGQSEGSQSKMQVRLESVLFPYKFGDINKYAELCAKLSSIYNNPHLPRSKEFGGYLSKVPKNRKDELDRLLHNELQQFFGITNSNGGVFGKLKDFLITQKNSTKYFAATKFHLYHKTKIIQTFEESPNLQDIHHIVRKNVRSNCISGLIQKFSELKIAIPPKKGERSVKESLFNCLEGIFYDDATEMSYWRVGGDWYQVSSRYTFEVYAEYIRVLKASLIDRDASPLKLKWPLKSELDFPDKKSMNPKLYRIELKKYRETRFVTEGIYNKLYKDQPSFIVTDSDVAPYGVEICDLFQCVPNPEGKPTIYLYHVKKAFNADGYRVAICQILCSAYFLHDSFKRDETSRDSAAFKLFQYIQKNRDKSLGIYEFNDYKEFMEHLRNATFVFSPLFDTGERELDKDFMALIKYDFSDFEDEIEPQFRAGLEIALYSFLLKEEYILPGGEFTAKWFETCSVGNDAGFYVCNETGSFIDPFPSREISNMDPKQLRRILKGKYYKIVDGLSIKQLIVHMSEVLHSMGFKLKICQIEGVVDDRLV